MLILTLVKADCSVCMNIPVFLARVQTKKKKLKILCLRYDWPSAPLFVHLQVIHIS